MQKSEALVFDGEDTIQKELVAEQEKNKKLEDKLNKINAEFLSFLK